MTWDEDCDGVLAIVGAAFLIMAPMVIWSGAFHTAFRTVRNQPIFVGWFLVLLVGLICGCQVFGQSQRIQQIRVGGTEMIKMSMKQSVERIFFVYTYSPNPKIRPKADDGTVSNIFI